MAAGRRHRGGAIGIDVDMRMLRRAVIAIIVVLYVIDVPASLYVHGPDGFDFDHPTLRFVLLKSERNIPTAYACAQLMACGALAVLHGLLSRHDRTGGTLRWLGMAAVFAYLTLDEGLGLHETFGPVADRILPGAGDYLFGWIVVGALVAVPVVAVYSTWVLALPPPIRRGLLIGGAVYVLGVFGLQVLSGGLRFDHPLYPVVSGWEELAELTGIAIFGLTLLTHLLRRIDRRPVLVTASAQPARTSA